MVTPEIHKLEPVWPPTPISHQSPTELGVYGTVQFSTAARMYGQNAPTLPSLPQWAKACFKTVTSPSFDCKGLFTFPYRDSIYSIFVLTLFCNAKNWWTETRKKHTKPTLVQLNWFARNKQNIKPCWFRKSQGCLSPGKPGVLLFTPAAMGQQDL